MILLSPSSVVPARIGMTRLADVASGGDHRRSPLGQRCGELHVVPPSVHAMAG